LYSYGIVISAVGE